MSLFDANDPDPRPQPEKKQPPVSRGRGGFTTPEKKEGIADLKDAMAAGDSYVLSRTMALSLYRLGAEPLNKLAVEMLSLLEGSV
jgi:hypothetical protein